MSTIIASFLEVHPAAGFKKTVRECGGKLAVFNLARTKDDEQADFLFLGKCEETFTARKNLKQLTVEIPPTQMFICAITVDRVS